MERDFTSIYRDHTFQRKVVPINISFSIAKYATMAGSNNDSIPNVCYLFKMKFSFSQGFRQG